MTTEADESFNNSNLLNALHRVIERIKDLRPEADTIFHVNISKRSLRGLFAIDTVMVG